MKQRNKYKLGKTSNRRRSGVSRYLNMTANRAIACSPIDFGVPYMGGKRTAEEQSKIFIDGCSSCDGYEKISNHQKTDKEGQGLALDLVPYVTGVGFDYNAGARFGIICMLMLEAWEELQDEGVIPKNLYLHSGALWRNKKASSIGWDPAHYEIRTIPQTERL